MHESLSRFGESFASFLYGLNMNAFVVDFPEAPVKEGVRRWQRGQGLGGIGDGGNSTILGSGRGAGVGDETTMVSGDTSHASLKATPRRKSVLPGSSVGTPGTAGTAAGTSRSGIPSSRGRGPVGGTRAGRSSGLPRGRGRGGGVR
jgi:DASH complex subunit DAM1